MLTVKESVFLERMEILWTFVHEAVLRNGNFDRLQICKPEGLCLVAGAENFPLDEIKIKNRK